MPYWLKCPLMNPRAKLKKSNQLDQHSVQAVSADDLVDTPAEPSLLVSATHSSEVVWDSSEQPIF